MPKRFKKQKKKMTKIFVTYAKKLMFLKTDYNYKLIKQW